jgi:hypothetical protein
LLERIESKQIHHNFAETIIIFNDSDMNKETKLVIIKTIHTLVWLFFNVVIFYMLYAVIVNKLDIWLWIGYGLFVLEGITLLVFKFFCPLTVIARKYSDSTKANFDIYLPNWLAKYNKVIYTSILGIIIIITIYQLLQ